MGEFASLTSACPCKTLYCAVRARARNPAVKGERAEAVPPHKVAKPTPPTLEDKVHPSFSATRITPPCHESMILVEPSSFQTDGGSPDPGSVASAGNSRAIPPCGSLNQLEK